MKMTKMKLSNLTSTILILASYFCVQSAPAKPLNERSTELTWQAWLLVDEQNQNKQYDAEGLLRRRITPKSVFIAPTFSPESLPACADGYTSDPMGRCIKIIQLDADAHLNFILDRLKQQFGNFDEYEDEEEEVDENLPTPGPLQFNIPLGVVPQAADPQEDTNVAIVVAPTNGNFNFSKNDSFTFTVKRDQNNTSQVDAPVIITKINIQDEISETTTEALPTTTEITTIQAEETTTEEISTVESTSQSDTTTYITENTEQEEEQAIFFRLPALNKPFETKVNETEVIDTTRLDNQFIQIPENSHIQLPPKIDMATKFREETAEIASHLIPHAKVKTKFDGLLDDIIKDVEHPDRIFTNRDTVKQKFANNKNDPAESNPQTNPLVNQMNSQENVQVNSQPNSQVNSQINPHIYNHRNRDKWFFPSNWRDTPPEKPLVLRFNNLPAGKQASHFYHHPRQGGMYREVPPEDLSYIFGFRKGTHR